MSDTDFDALIVGSGMGGLTSAIVLAQEGQKVCVVEQHYRAGGSMHRFFRNRLGFDTGFHYFGGVGEGGTMHRYLRFLGLGDALSFHALDPDGFDVLKFPDFEFRIPNGWPALVRRLKSEFPGEAGAIDRFASVCQDICAGSLAYSFTEPKLETTSWTEVTLKGFVDTLTSNERLKACLFGQCLLYGVKPSQAPLELHAFVVDSMLQGAAGVDGGGDAIAKAMVARIKSLGGQVRLATRVVALDTEGGRVTAAHLETKAPKGAVERTRVCAKNFISNAHPKETLRWLDSAAVSGAYRSRVEGLTESVSCLAGYFVKDDDGTPARNHNLYAYPSYDIDEAFTNLGFGDEAANAPSLFMTFPGDREMPKGPKRTMLALGLMRYGSAARFGTGEAFGRTADYEAQKERWGRELREAVGQAAPDWSGRVEMVELSTPLTYRDYLQAPEGGIYGSAKDMNQWGRYAMRPKTRLPNLLLTGQDVLMPGIVGATISGVVTCAYVLGFGHVFGKVAAA